MKDIFIVQNANDEGCVAVGSYNARVPLEGTPYRYNPTATNFQVHSLRSCASPSLGVPSVALGHVHTC